MIHASSQAFALPHLCPQSSHVTLLFSAQKLLEANVLMNDTQMRGSM